MISRILIRYNKLLSDLQNGKYIFVKMAFFSIFHCLQRKDLLKTLSSGFIAALLLLLVCLFYLPNSWAITTASKTPEDSFKSSSAVYVISRTDIKNSGATNIADVLRTVPGLQVAQGESEQLLVTSRGFANGFANKLLVMVDGRSIYTPVFSGVHWGIQNIILENIKQIEVIRGPGATQWGANAVNGVINIITEPAVNTQKSSTYLTYGNNISSVAIRHGGKIKDNSYYRVNAASKKQESNDSLYRNNADNDSLVNKVGFRVDYDEFEKDLITLQGDIYDGYSNVSVFLPDVVAENNFANYNDKLSTYGNNIIANWDRKINKDEEVKLQVFYDRAVRNHLLLSRRYQTIDLDLQYSNSIQELHEITSGIGYRYINSNLKYGTFRLNFEPSKRNDNIFSAFIQDKIAILPDKFFLTLGSKFEHNDFTGYEVQPSIKTSWIIDENQTFWASIARAIRTPSISEHDINMVVSTYGSAYARQSGDVSFDSEKLTAYEMGYRARPNDNSLVDLAIFYNDYSDLRTAEYSGIPTFESGSFFLDFLPYNNGKAKSYGLELSGEFDVSSDWSLKGGYTYLKLDLDAKSFSSDVELEKEQKRSPKHQFNIQSSLDLSDNLTMNNILYYVDSIVVVDNYANNVDIPSYYRFDSNVSWQYSRNLSFDLVGQNLFDDLHAEFSGYLWGEPVQVGRTVYIKSTLRF